MKLTEKYGNYSGLKILDCLNESKIDLSVINIIEQTGLCRKTVDVLLQRYEEGGLIQVNRKIGKTKLYIISKNIKNGN